MTAWQCWYFTINLPTTVSTRGSRFVLNLFISCQKIRDGALEPYFPSAIPELQNTYQKMSEYFDVIYMYSLLFTADTKWDIRCYVILVYLSICACMYMHMCPYEHVYGNTYGYVSVWICEPMCLQWVCGHACQYVFQASRINWQWTVKIKCASFSRLMQQKYSKMTYKKMPENRDSDKTGFQVPRRIILQDTLFQWLAFALMERMVGNCCWSF